MLRAPRTTTVLAVLSLTTTPCKVRFGIFVSLLLLLRALLRGDSLDPGDVTAGLAPARGIFELPGGAVGAQVEALLLQIQDCVILLVGAQRADVFDLHLCHGHYSAMRSTKRVLIGSLAAASVSASFAVCTVTPSISKSTRPGLTRATHSSGAPLPEPMRTSAGFFDTGTSGNTRIQPRPARFMWRVSARRAASIWRAVTRSGSVAFRPNWPNANVAPEVATPWIRPLCAFRNFVFFGCIMAYALKPSVVSRSVAARTGTVAFGHLLVLGHRIVLEDFALEDPDLDAAGAERGERSRNPVVDVGAQRVQRHAAFAIPLHARDFGAAQASRAVDTNAFGAKTHRRLHRALHGAAECDAALKLLGDRFGDQGGVEFGLADFDDVDDDVGSRNVGNPLAQLVDVGALLADHDAGTCRMDRHAALLVRTLDHDAGNGCLLEFLV